MKTVQFSGETPWDAIVNHYSLDLEDEQSFREFCDEAQQIGDDAGSPPLDLERLEELYEDWAQEERPARW